MIKDKKKNVLANFEEEGGFSGLSSKISESLASTSCGGVTGEGWIGGGDMGGV
jgi:hypothetical protein